MGQFEEEKLAVTGEIFFFLLSQKEKFLEPIKKDPYIVVITGEPVPAPCP